MTSKATYRGHYPVFGVSRNHTYTIDIQTVGSEYGSPYLWVRVHEHPDYLMPYESVGALLAEWDFALLDHDNGKAMLVKHVELTERWLEIYVPGHGGVC